MPDLFFEIKAGESVAENVQRMSSPAPTDAKQVPDFWFRIEGEGGAQNAFAFAVENPTGKDLAIVEAVHYLKTKGATASAVLDIDVGSSATATGDTIFDGIAIGSGATEGAIVSSQILADSGTNGDEKPKVWNKAGGTNDFLTGKILAAAAAAYVGVVLVHCVPLEDA